MAVKVIGLPRDLQKIRCNHCDSLLEFRSVDTVFCPEEYDKFKYIVCPQCRKRVYLKTDWEKDLEDSRFY